jgi:hypothetical protein
MSQITSLGKFIKSEIYFYVPFVSSVTIERYCTGVNSGQSVKLFCEMANGSTTVTLVLRSHLL